MITKSEIEAGLKGVVSDRFIELWWDLRIPSFNGKTPKEVYEEDPARLLKYTGGYKNESFS